LIAADRVILVTHNRPVTDLYDALRGEWPVFLVGDANAPRDIQAAIREGHLAGRGAATLRRVAAVT
jgi:heterodisulfide reductase subunit A-like polyferredoxin